MGKIAEYQRAPLRSNVDVGAIDRAGNVSRAAASFAQDASNLAFKAQEVQDNNYIATQAHQMEETAKQEFAKHQQENAENPTKTYSKLQDRLTAAREESLANAPSPRARQRLTMAANNLDQSFKTMNSQWEIEQGVKNTGTAAANGFEAIQVEALRGSNPALVDQLEAKGQLYFDNLSKVAAPQIVEKARQDFRKNLAVSSFEGMINSEKYEEAKKALDSKKYDAHLGADGISHLQKVIKQGQEAREAKRANIESLKWSNPYEFVQKVGDTKGLAPLNPADPGSFKQRQLYVEYANAKYGMAMPLMSKDEVSQFSVSLSKGNPAEQARHLTDLSASLAPSQYSAFTAQVYKERPAMGAAMALAQTDPGVTQDIIRGSQLLESKAIKVSSTSEETVRLSYEDMVKRAIPDPTMRAQVYESVKAIAAHKAYESGSAEFDKDDVEASISRVLGPIVNINGREALSFKDHTGTYLGSKKAEHSVDEVFEDLTPDDIKKASGDVPRDSSGAAIELDEITSNYYLETIGEGIYYVKNKESQTYAATKDGKPFELQLKQIYFNKYAPKEDVKRTAAATTNPGPAQ